jgi:signal transduction histidine kinase
MRREIARQMHDGPAQSIANIALQAQIVQRLFESDTERAKVELGELVNMVQQALEATKSFIFDVRPMVLDDLGLVPTLRRSAREASRRSGTQVRFESVGADRRLSTGLESGLFRIIDDTVVGYLELKPIELVVRLDWSEIDVRATVRARPAGADESAETKARAAVANARRDRALPQALATMIHEQESQAAARNAGLPQHVRAEIERRAAPLGVRVAVSDDRWQVELTAGRNA